MSIGKFFFTWAPFFHFGFLQNMRGTVMHGDWLLDWQFIVGPLQITKIIHRKDFYQ